MGGRSSPPAVARQRVRCQGTHTLESAAPHGQEREQKQVAERGRGRGRPFLSCCHSSPTSTFRRISRGLKEGSGSASQPPRRGRRNGVGTGSAACCGTSGWSLPSLGPSFLSVKRSGSLVHTFWPSGTWRAGGLQVRRLEVGGGLAKGGIYESPYGVLLSSTSATATAPGESIQPRWATQRNPVASPW